jgi:hypothetical protein
MAYYTVKDFQDFIFNGIDTKLDENTRNILKDLSSKIVSNDSENVNYQKIKRGSGDELFNKKGYRDKGKDSFTDENWDNIRNFKTTVIEKKKGIEKKINEIRIALNKFSTKSKKEQTIKIIGLIDDVLNEDGEDGDDGHDMEENMNKITGFIFNIASSNAFFSDIYAEFYMNLINKYSVFGSKMTNIVENYKASYNDIKPVDPNEDYDAYCVFIKENDARKAMTTFMCNLTKYDVLEQDVLLAITDYIIELLPRVAETDNSMSVVEEYSDNLYIMITTAYELYKNTDEFNETTISKLEEISKLRKTNKEKYKSMSSRASFKMMDLLDYIKKH